MMNKTALLSLFMVLMIVTPSFQLGILWVNQIWGNFDTNRVVIEEIIVDDNTVQIDFLTELSGNGVNVEDTILKDGSVDIPVNLHVGQVSTFDGLLNANGGLIADAGDNGGFSFRIEDDTGITTINGELRPNGGINMDNGKFTVQDETGETTIAEALLRPNGGINVSNGKFTVDGITGDVLTQGFAYVQQDILLGTSNPDDRYIKRFDSAFDVGGNTFISGQSSANTGGDLILEPGYGTEIGKILFGRSAGDELYIGRVGIQGSASYGGATHFNSQSTTTGRGGDLFLRAGNGGNGQQGGDLILSPGLSNGNSGTGVIYLGTDDCVNEVCNSDIAVRRPPSTLNAGGATILAGQDSDTGRGGDFIVRAGNSDFNDGGDLYLQPGYGQDSTQLGYIYIGRNVNDDLHVRRPASPQPAGGLYLVGQDSATGNGGDIFIVAGNGPVGATGGDIYLSTGHSGSSGVAGTIVWGNNEDDLIVNRPLATGAATLTAIYGQDSAFSNGGDVLLASGNGGTNGGLLTVAAGFGTGNGGVVSILGGDGSVTGGDIAITGGAGSTGGDITILSGAGVIGGSVIIQGGTGSNAAGSVVIRNSDIFLVDGAAVHIQAGDLYVQGGPCPDGSRPADCTTNPQVRLSADPDSVLSYYDVSQQQYITLLKQRQLNVPVPQNPVGGVTVGNYISVIGDLNSSLFSLVNALGQCGHGLINVRGLDGSVAYPGGCIFPGPIPDITGGLTLPAGLPTTQQLSHV